MSTYYITAARRAKVGNSTRKLLLIMLADNANDDGWCWPSHKRLADDCEVSDRSIRTHIKELAKGGFIEIHPMYDQLTKTRTGTRYRLLIRLHETSTHRKEIPHPPERDSAPLRKDFPPNRHIEPSIEPSYSPPYIPPQGGDAHALEGEVSSSPSQPKPPSKPKKETPRQILERVLSKEDADDVIEHRQRLRKPLTPRAAKLLANAFSEIEPSMRSEAVDMMISSGWVGFKAEWFNNRSSSQAARQSSGAGMQPSELLAENVMRISSQHIGRHTREALVRWAISRRGYVLSRDWKAVLVEIDTVMKSLDREGIIDELMALAIEDLAGEEDGAKLNADMIMRRYNRMHAEWRGETKEVYEGDTVRFETVHTPAGDRLRRRVAERFGSNLLEDGRDGE